MEQVLVVPTLKFHELGYFQGFCTDAQKYRDELLRPENVRFLPRDKAEQDPSFKQLIPYMIFCYTDSQGQLSVFRYVRGKGQGEARLHSKASVGVGGHISSIDLAENGKMHDLYREGMRRELEEEVVLEADYTETCVGLINDDLTEVGKVHLGVVHRFDLKEPKLRSNEPDLIECGFVPVSELLQNLDGFESWSSICLTALF